MKDRIKGYLSILFFALALILPLALLLATGVGWLRLSWKTGVVAAVSALVVCFVLGIVLALRVQAPTWLEIATPFLAGLVYSVANLIPLPIDDVLATLAGAGVSYTLALKRYTAAPRWIIAPPLAAALYTLVGELVPGPVDELAVGLVAAIVSSVVAGMSARRARAKEMLQEEPPAAHEELAVKASARDG
jgi:hypothetical protein